MPGSSWIEPARAREPSTHRAAGSRARRFIALGFWLGLWQVVAMATGPLVLASPIEVAASLARLVPTTTFWLSLGNSMARIAGGLLLGTAVGSLTGAAATQWGWAAALLEPLMRVFRTVPVVTFVILVLIWSGPAALTVTVTAMVVAPVAYENLVAGLANRDRELVEVSEVFGARGLTRFRALTWPAVLPFARSGAAVAIGLAWKAGVSAEVIGLPATSIGERLFAARLTLATADVLAWTAVIVAASWGFERLVGAALRAPR